jgi:uncharacterized membrane protein YedE/YeeE
MSGLVAFLVGAIFALGLGVGGMTQPARVLAFLDVAGDWDPSLALVMLGAVAIYAVAFRVCTRRARPFIAARFDLPARRDIDRRLMTGATVFGIGWGLAGLCPGPALTSLASGRAPALVFVAAMLAGMAVQRLVERRAQVPHDGRTGTPRPASPATERRAGSEATAVSRSD